MIKVFKNEVEFEDCNICTSRESTGVDVYKLSMKTGSNDTVFRFCKKHLLEVKKAIDEAVEEGE